MSRASAREQRYQSALGPLFAEPLDGRMVPAMRLTLAVSALAIIFVDPSEPDRLIAATYGALVLYVLYSAGLFLLARRRGALSRWFHDWSHWIDLGWYTLLVALSSGTGSIFFFGFLFASLTASFRWGLASGLRVTVASTALFTAVGLTAAPPGPAFELNRFLLRPAYLLVLGYMMAQWGGFQIALNRKLALLNELSAVANPRLGADHLVDSILWRLCEFFEADAGLLVRRDGEGAEYRVHRVERGGRPARAEAVPAETSRMLLAIPDAHAVLFNGGPRAWWARRDYTALDADGRPGGDGGRAACATLAAALEADSLVSVPMRYAGRTLGRLFVVSRRRAFAASDMTFLLQVVRHLVPLLENIRLVDRLASTAAEQERLRIARTIHDSVIQPYIGLQIGLEAVLRKLVAGDRSVARDVTSLTELTAIGIADLRRCVRGLEQESGDGDGLQSAVRRFAAIFAEASRIEVRVDADPELPVNDRLAAELFQMIAEGLSNVRRHANAARARVGLASRDGRIEVCVENDDEHGLVPHPFTPRSIAERAAALGGSVRVEGRDGGGVVVLVEVPL